MRLQAVIARLSERARSDARITSRVGQSSTSTSYQAGIRDEYRNIVRGEFPGCAVAFQWGRIIVTPPPGYLEVRGGVGAPIGPSLMGALFFGLEIKR